MIQDFVWVLHSRSVGASRLFILLARIEIAPAFHGCDSGLAWHHPSFKPSKSVNVLFRIVSVLNILILSERSTFPSFIDPSCGPSVCGLPVGLPSTIYIMVGGFCGPFAYRAHSGWLILWPFRLPCTVWLADSVAFPDYGYSVRRVVYYEWSRRTTIGPIVHRI